MVKTEALLHDVHQGGGEGKVKVWLKAVRAPFFTATAVPVILGAVVYWYQTSTFYWGFFLLTLAAAIFLHAGTNLSNDYYDHVSGADELNKTPTPFSGGSRVIQDGLLTPKEVHIGVWIGYVLSGIVGAVIITLLTWSKGWPILVLGAIGILGGYFYTANPLKVGYWGAGELLVGLGYGPLLAFGSYFVQAAPMQRFYWFEPIYAAIPVAILIATVLYINEFPDYSADRAAGKKHLIVLLGRNRAIKGYPILFALAYLVLIVGVVFKVLPLFTLIALLTIPIAIKAVSIARDNYDKEPLKLVPAMGMTINIHLITGLLISIGYVIDKLVLG